MHNKVNVLFPHKHRALGENGAHPLEEAECYKLLSGGYAHGGKKDGRVVLKDKRMTKSNKCILFPLGGGLRWMPGSMPGEVAA